MKRIVKEECQCCIDILAGLGYFLALILFMGSVIGLMFLLQFISMLYCGEENKECFIPTFFGNVLITGFFIACFYAAVYYLFKIYKYRKVNEIDIWSREFTEKEKEYLKEIPKIIWDTLKFSAIAILFFICMLLLVAGIIACLVVIVFPMAYITIETCDENDSRENGLCVCGLIIGQLIGFFCILSLCAFLIKIGCRYRNEVVQKDYEELREN